MSYNPKDYHIDTRSLGSGLLPVVVVLCGMGLASMDLNGTVQRGWAAMAGEMHLERIVQCS